MDYLRQQFQQPILRPLLLGVGRSQPARKRAHLDEHLDRWRDDLECRGEHCRSGHRAGRPARRASPRYGRRAHRERRSARRCSLSPPPTVERPGTPRHHLDHHRSRRGRQPAHLSTALGCGGCCGQGLCGLAGLPLPQRVALPTTLCMSTSSDGSNWTAPVGIPIDAVSSTVDHFIPAIAVDPATSGGSARLALTYYFYPTAQCTAATCQLNVGLFPRTMVAIPGVPRPRSPGPCL